jgi:hypothetical protein
MSCMNKQSDAGMRAVLTLRMDLRWFSSAFCVLVFSSVTTRAHSSPATPPSQLARENLSRATASAGDIKAVLGRPQVRELEEKSRREMILRVRDVQNNLLFLPDTDPEQRFARGMACEQCQTNLTAFSAEPALRRVVTPISLHMNGWKDSAQDVELEARDRLTIPKRPGYVTVTVQVSTPTAASYRPGRRRGAQRNRFDKFLTAGGESQ